MKLCISDKIPRPPLRFGHPLSKGDSIASAKLFSKCSEFPIGSGAHRRLADGGGFRDYCGPKNSFLITERCAGRLYPFMAMRMPSKRNSIRICVPP